MFQAKYQLSDHTVMFDDESKQLRWFVLPSEAAACLSDNLTHNIFTLPFCPPAIRERIGIPPFVEEYSEEEPCEKDSVGYCYYHSIKDRTKFSVKMVADQRIDQLEKTVSSGHQNSEIECLDTQTGKHEINTISNDKDSLYSQLSRKCESRLACQANTYSTNKDINIIQTISKGDFEQGLAESKTSNTETARVNEAGSSTMRQVHVNKNCDIEVKSVDYESVKDEFKDKAVCHRIGEGGRDNTGMEKALEAKENEPETKSKSSTEDECEADKCDKEESRNRKRTVEKNSETDVVLNKKVKEGQTTEDTGGNKAGKKKLGLKWYSPPKTIFAPFLKVSYKIEKGKVVNTESMLSLTCLSLTHNLFSSHAKNVP